MSESRSTYNTDNASAGPSRLTPGQVREENPTVEDIEHYVGALNEELKFYYKTKEGLKKTTTPKTSQRLKLLQRAPIKAGWQQQLR
jgi:hypothetical protein